MTETEQGLRTTNSIEGALESIHGDVTMIMNSMEKVNDLCRQEFTEMDNRLMHIKQTIREFVENEYLAILIASRSSYQA